MRNLVALGVDHLCRINYVNRTKTMDWKRKTTNRGANVLGELVAIGAGLLPGKEGSIKHLRNNICNSHLHMVTGNFSHLFIVTRRQVSRGSLGHTESFTCSKRYSDCRHKLIIVITNSQTWWGMLLHFVLGFFLKTIILK